MQLAFSGHNLCHHDSWDWRNVYSNWRDQPPLIKHPENESTHDCLAGYCVIAHAGFCCEAFIKLVHWNVGQFSNMCFLCVIFFSMFWFINKAASKTTNYGVNLAVRGMRVMKIDPCYSTSLTIVLPLQGKPQLGLLHLAALPRLSTGTARHAPRQRNMSMSRGDPTWCLMMLSTDTMYTN